MNQPAPAPRLIELDALRGFAVMGILAMNIVAFAWPEMAYVSPTFGGGTSPQDLWAWFIAFVLFDGKMRGLFSLLFGASMILIAERAEASGQSAAKVHYRRMAWLAVIALCHFYLIWFGDILFLYAAVGSIAFLFYHWEARRLIKWGLIAYGLGAIVFLIGMGIPLVMQFLASQPGADASMAEVTADLAKGITETHKAMASETALITGPYSALVHYRLTEDLFSPIFAVFTSIMETLPLMMLGMGLYRNGFLTGHWDAVDYRRWITRLLPAGGLLTILIAAIMWGSGFDFYVMLNGFMAWTIIPRLMMTIAYAALLILLIRRAANHPLIHRVAAAGRMAFSNYLGTSLVMTAIFYGWGLGLYGQVPRATLYLFVLGAWIAMLAWSLPWLRTFRYGPFEWLWRSLARWQIQPMRIK